MFSTQRFQFTVVFLISIILGNKVSAQEKDSSFFLFHCGGYINRDTAVVEIKGIGEVKSISYVFADLEETGWTYYFVPENKRTQSASKLSQLLADTHKEIWKNNSRIVTREKLQVGDACIIDLRLHILIEDIYMQVLAISEPGKLYEVMCFRDTNDKAYFDRMVDNIKKKQCPQ